MYVKYDLGKPKWSSSIIINELLAQEKLCKAHVKGLHLEAHPRSLQYQPKYCIEQYNL